jgi:hypothetical protein
MQMISFGLALANISLTAISDNRRQVGINHA